jgi:hypothetical protein
MQLLLGVDDRVSSDGILDDYTKSFDDRLVEDDTQFGVMVDDGQLQLEEVGQLELVLVDDEQLGQVLVDDERPELVADDTKVR